MQHLVHDAEHLDGDGVWYGLGHGAEGQRGIRWPRRQLGVFLALRNEGRHQRHVVVDGRLLVADEAFHDFAQLVRR